MFLFYIFYYVQKMVRWHIHLKNPIKHYRILLCWFVFSNFLCSQQLTKQKKTLYGRYAHENLKSMVDDALTSFF